VSDLRREHLLPTAAARIGVAFAGHEFHRGTLRGPRPPAAAAAAASPPAAASALISSSHKFSIVQLPLSYCKM